MFIGGLSAHDLVGQEIVGGSVMNEGRIPLPARICGVEQEPALRTDGRE